MEFQILTLFLAFLLTGFFSGLIGALCGSMIGVVIALNLTYITNFLQDITGITLLNQSIYLTREKIVKLLSKRKKYQNFQKKRIPVKTKKYDVRLKNGDQTILL